MMENKIGALDIEQEIEAGAVAIWLAFTRRLARGKDGRGWDDMPEKLKQQYRDEARACVQAIDEFRRLRDDTQ